MAIVDEKFQVGQRQIPCREIPSVDMTLFISTIFGFAAVLPCENVSIKQMLDTLVRIDVSIMIALAPESAVTSTMALITL